MPDLNLNFGDFNFKWNYRINNNNRLFFTLINTRDALANLGTSTGDKAGIQWNNFAMTFRWNHIFSPKLFSNTILNSGNYQYKLSSTQDVWHSGIGKVSLKSDFTYYTSAVLTSKFGIEFHGYAFNPGKILVGSLSALFPTIRQDNSRQSVLYYNAAFRLAAKWRFHAGARLSRWTNHGPAEYYTFDDQHALQDTVTPARGFTRITGASIPAPACSSTSTVPLPSN